jgi:flagellar operon protein
MSEIPRFDPRIQAPRGPALPKAPATKGPEGGGFEPLFASLLEQAGSAEVKFSAHALERLRERNIHLSGHDLEGIRSAVDQAAAKGCRESLLLKSDLALVVNVKNRTVITALPGRSMKDHVFTNIDSAVLLD